MIAIIDVIIINNHSLLERGFQTLHKTEILTFLSGFFFFPKRKQKFAAKTKMIDLLQAGATVYFSGPCVYSGAILLYLFVPKAKSSAVWCSK